MISYVRFPLIRFSKARLHNWAKQKYITSENEAQERVDISFLKYAQLYASGKNERARILNYFYKFDPVSNTLYNLIKGFTYRETDEKAIKDLIDALEIVQIKAEIVDDVLYVKSDDLSFNVKKLTNLEPLILRRLPDIDKPSRGGRCHPYGVITALFYDKAKDFETHLVTGRIYQLSPDAKYLHSWVEISDSDATFVIDSTRNAVYSKEAFYKINHVGDVVRLHSSIINKDYKMIRKLTDYDDYAVKVYYENPERGRKLYKKLVKLGEISEENDMETIKSSVWL